MDKPDFGYENEFVDFAADAKKGLNSLIVSLVDMTKRPAESLDTAALEHFLEEAYAIEGDIVELEHIVENIDRPIDRGDLYQHTLSMIEAAFYIGRYSASDVALKRARKVLGSRAGKASGAARQKASEQWKFVLLKRAQNGSASNHDRLVEEALHNWPNDRARPPSFRTASDFLRDARKEGLLERTDNKPANFT